MLAPALGQFQLGDVSIPSPDQQTRFLPQRWASNDRCFCTEWGIALHRSLQAVISTGGPCLLPCCRRSDIKQRRSIPVYSNIAYTFLPSHLNITEATPIRVCRLLTATLLLLHIYSSIPTFLNKDTMLWTHHLPTLWALTLTLLTPVLSSPITLRTTGPWLALDTDFPDPGFVQADDGTWYAFGTNGNNRTVQVAKSTDFKTWTLLDKEALPTLAGWETQIDHWAPDVVRRVTTPPPPSSPLLPPKN